MTDKAGFGEFPGNPAGLLVEVGNEASGPESSVVTVRGITACRRGVMFSNGSRVVGTNTFGKRRLATGGNWTEARR